MFKYKKNCPKGQLKKRVVIRYKNKRYVKFEELEERYKLVKRANPNVDVFIEVNR